MSDLQNCLKLTFAVGLTTVALAACGDGSSSSGSTGVDPDVATYIEELEAKIPTRERASVRVCEELIMTRLENQEDVLAFVTWGLKELETSEDPRGMFIALSEALIAAGDALMVGD